MHPGKSVTEIASKENSKQVIYCWVAYLDVVCSGGKLAML